ITIAICERRGYFPIIVMAFTFMLYSGMERFPMLMDFSMIGGFYRTHQNTLIAALAIAILPNKAVMGTLNRIEGRLNISLNKSEKAVFLLGVFIASSLLFALNPVDVQRGDYQTVPQHIKNGYIDVKEPASLALHSIFYRMIYSHFSKTTDIMESIISSIKFMHAVYGGVFTVIILLLSEELFEKKTERAIFMLALLGNFAILYSFLGSIDIYAPTLVGLTTYVLCATRYLNGKSNIYCPSFALAIAANIHLSNMWFAPTIPLLVLLKHGRLDMECVKKMTKASLVFTISAAALYTPTFMEAYHAWDSMGEKMAYWAGDMGGGDKNAFKAIGTIFSVYNINLIATEYILITMPGLVVVIYGLIKTDVRRIKDDRILTLLTAIFLTYLTYTIVHENDGQLNVDWNLYTNAALTTTLFGLKNMRDNDQAIILKAMIIAVIMHSIPLLAGHYST
ncbi:MAG: hypothetical protein ABIH11_00405, partial [Candidatus Altiarchaeota archaeon]